MAESVSEIVTSNGRIAHWAGEHELAERINGPMIRLWNEMVQDANPLYHDRDLARTRGYPDIVAPPAMLLAWTFEPTWRPDGGAARTHERDLPPVPGYPHGAVLSITQTYNRLLSIGESPFVRYYRGGPTEEVETPRGVGAVTWQVMQLCDPDGHELVRQESEVLRFARVTPTAPRARPRPFDGPRSDTRTLHQPGAQASTEPGSRIPPLEFPVPLRHFVLAVAATRDFYQVHHDDAYARALGATGMYIGTHFMQGLIGRFVTDWSGPDGRMRSMKLTPFERNHPGDVIRVDGWVTGRSDHGERCVVDLAVSCSNDRGLTHEAEASVVISTDQSGRPCRA
jgi:N-terminal half of MaoC dehydratase